MNPRLLVCLLALTGCVGRALDPEPSTVSDGASSSSDALFSADDLSARLADMASNEGVPCAGDVCKSPESCCWDGVTLHCSDACPAYENLDCDGPEDCPPDEKCLGNWGGGVAVAPATTHCGKPYAADPLYDQVVCRTQNDCPRGLTCAPEPPVATEIDGLPPMSVCVE